MPFIESKKGLTKLLERFEQAPKMSSDPSTSFTPEEKSSRYWIKVIKFAIENDLPMDEIDYQNTPKDYRKLWKGLK